MRIKTFATASATILSLTLFSGCVTTGDYPGAYSSSYPSTTTSYPSASSADRCYQKNWYALGKRDGRNGRAEDYIYQRARGCNHLNMSAQYDSWRQGRRDALRSSCSSQQAYNLGKRGRSLPSACYQSSTYTSGYQYQRAQNSFNQGSKVYAVKKEISSLRREIDRLEAQIARKQRQKNSSYATKNHNNHKGGWGGFVQRSGATKDPITKKTIRTQVKHQTNSQNQQELRQLRRKLDKKQRVLAVKKNQLQQLQR